MSGMERLELFDECKCNLVGMISMHILKNLRILKNRFQVTCVYNVVQLMYKCIVCFSLVFFEYYIFFCFGKKIDFYYINFYKARKKYLQTYFFIYSFLGFLFSSFVTLTLASIVSLHTIFLNCY